MIRTTLIAAFATFATQAAAHPHVAVHVHQASVLPLAMGIVVILTAVAAATLVRGRAR